MPTLMAKSNRSMGGLAEQLGGWEVQILLLSSLLLQVLLLVFTEWRRRASRWARLSAALNGIMWLLYLLADSVAIYVLGHMALSCKPREQQQLMAFWASLLLVHLGGQDTITAYAMEDNDLWLRHLLTLVVQAAGAAYVLYKYVGRGALLAASLLMFMVGVVKYGERIYALKSSGLDSIRKFLDGFEVPVPERDKPYQDMASPDDPEEVLQGAHDLLHICMGQLVDYRVWPSLFQTRAIAAYHGGTNPKAGRSMLTQLVGMQLSLMRDILYTKALVIGAWYGCLSRTASIAATVVAFCLFREHSSAMGGGRGYSRRDMVVTYTLLGGAFVLEVVSLLRTILSTWTCASLRASSCSVFIQLHEAVLRVRRGAKEAEGCRKWPASIGQHDIFELHSYRKRSTCYLLMDCLRLEQRWIRLRFFGSVIMSRDVEDMVVSHIEHMVQDYVKKNHNRTQSGLGQLVLGGWGKDGAGGSLYASVAGLDQAGFDGSILAWHYATDAFLWKCNLDKPTRPDMTREERRRQKSLVKTIRTLSRYMVFLLVERPHLLPSPVRRSQYDSFCSNFHGFMDNRRGQQGPYDNQPEVQLAYKVLNRCNNRRGVERVLRLIARVWVEMLCYAASHCSNDSHARQLSSSTEFITITWILTTALYYNWCHHKDPRRFTDIASRFLERHERHRNSRKRLWSTIMALIRRLVSRERPL